eukprot:8672814-Ditylum_brightwellii.AAC.1
MYCFYKEKKGKNVILIATKADIVAISVLVVLVQVIIVIVELRFIPFAEELTTLRVAWVVSILALLNFFVILRKKIKKIREQDEAERAEIFSQTLRPVNVYQDVSLDP